MPRGAWKNCGQRWASRTLTMDMIQTAGASSQTSNANAKPGGSEDDHEGVATVTLMAGKKDTDATKNLRPEV